jgi:hypothetical protein
MRPLFGLATILASPRVTLTVLICSICLFYATTSRASAAHDDPYATVNPVLEGLIKTITGTTQVEVEKLNFGDDIPYNAKAAYRFAFDAGANTYEVKRFAIAGNGNGDVLELWKQGGNKPLKKQKCPAGPTEAAVSKLLDPLKN